MGHCQHKCEQNMFHFSLWMISSQLRGALSIFLMFGSRRGMFAPLLKGMGKTQHSSRLCANRLSLLFPRLLTRRVRHDVTMFDTLNGRPPIRQLNGNAAEPPKQPTTHLVPATSNSNKWGRVGAIVALSLITVFLSAYVQHVLLSNKSYAICSRDGQHIYTVEESEPRVQCMVVDGGYIRALGSLGWFHPSSRRLTYID